MRLTVQEYLTEDGESPFALWVKRLDFAAAAKVAVAVYRLEQDNFSNVEGVGKGIFEFKIDFGPGYRIYLANDGEKLVILLGGGSKKRQSTDISSAQACWQDYKRRKR